MKGVEVNPPIIPPTTDFKDFDSYYTSEHCTTHASTLLSATILQDYEPANHKPQTTNHEPRTSRPTSDIHQTAAPMLRQRAPERPEILLPVCSDMVRVK